MKSKGEFTREKIIAEATRLVQQKGFQATSMADLVEATGMQKGCLYFHFAGKDELLLAILEQAKSDFFQLIDAALHGATPGERLENFLVGTLEHQKANGFDCGCIFGNIALEMSGKDPRVAAFVKGLFDEWTVKIREVVVAAQQVGQVTSQVAPEILAQQIIMSLEGGIMLAKLEKNERPLRDCLAALRVMIGLHLG
ncbi:MAG: TetR family transcriptional regulator [Desulfobulbaceae bacterium A2]|nr:MAG: TetR family transcriptional regulator [Desulfobulbaceae bacterium A2]